MKFVKNIVILLSSLAAVLTVCENANAGKGSLNVGAKIPPGQERQLLQYQLQNDGKGLRQIRVIPECVVGFALGCNKTGTILEQVIQSNGGPTYQQMLMRAAGGEDNYRKFSSFYGYNPNPYASVWRRFDREILDSVQYSSGSRLSSNPVAGLRDVTKNFLLAPLRGSDPRSGFINLKISYVNTLLQEASKIPNLEQEIRQLGLEPRMTEFYVNNIARGLNALRSGNNKETQEISLRILSHPYTSVLTGQPYGREPQTLVAFSEEGATIPGGLKETLATPGESEFVQGEELGGDELLISSPESLPVMPFMALLPLVVLLALLGGDRNSSSSSPPGTSGFPTPPTNPPSNVCDFVNPDGNPNGGVCETPITQPPTEVTRVMEPSTMKAILLLTLIFCLVRYKQRCAQAKY
ncbi:hypothetical protein [Nostoc parmelioides]|uniref:Uncharacterized protein n=1 Tax=Nostoc parmelioides FACHB-3921 TaxID=2692909 RepID=A0ABR8BAC0_9NOSO|nr:hypothetical protein [Nostoc parmelioides]MBD2251027.1 hypothetical protein [Nostoc parmelioides FACHB-3921]